MSLEIIIAGDAVIGKDNAAEFQTSTPGLLLGGLGQLWQAADARVFTLASPLTDAAGCCAEAAAPACAEGIAALNPTGVNLCTERIAACGEAGILATRAALKSRQVAFFGAGEDTDEADQPFFFVRHGVRVGLYAVCADEGACATERKAGSNPLDLINLGDRVREIKSNCDRLVVIYRGGTGGYPYPTPFEQKVCRKAAECGASLVLSEGSHTAGCSERWNNTTIAYGLGGFLGGEAQAGLLVRYTVGDYGADTVEFVPVTGTLGKASLAGEAEAAALLETFEKRSLRVRIEGFVPARFAEMQAASA